MDPDLALVIGTVFGIFAIPSVLSALTDRRAPRASAITVIVAGGLILYAVQTKSGGYTFEQIPGVFTSVIARYLP